MRPSLARHRMRVRSSSARPDSSARMPRPEGVVRSSPSRFRTLMVEARPRWICSRLTSLPGQRRARDPRTGQGQSTSETGQDRCGAEDFSVVPKKANGEYHRLPALTVDLVNRQVAAIVAGGSLRRRLPRSRPQPFPVFNSGVDPVTAGIVASLSRPGGNVTGVNSLGDAYRLVGIYVAKILKGAKPGDRPVVQPTKSSPLSTSRRRKPLGTPSRSSYCCASTRWSSKSRLCSYFAAEAQAETGT